MMLQHVHFAKRIAKDGSGLIDNCGIRDDVNNAAQPVLHCMFQGKGEGRKRLPAACRHRERVNTAHRLRRAETILLHLVSFFCKLCLWRAEISEFLEQTLI
ncbi:hypothetical protein SDC9_116236 [bioreactor metagenome]|uniref:Uncharacterized protein n=1 Tax=bioreactor metagenome TaxID=1076179 RepID=A0A645BVL0_9ZZZZ